MTLILSTRSHGKVNSGFLSTFTAFARLGEYTFVTRHFCELIQEFAKNPQLDSSRMIVYPEEIFVERSEEYLEKIMNTEWDRIDDALLDLQGNAPVTDELDL